MTLGEWLPIARARLEAAGVDAPALISQVVAGHALLRDRAWILAHPEAEVPHLALEVMLSRLEALEPLAYVIGRREFFGLEFEVTSAVLIPRQETELLVEIAIKLIPSEARVLDIGTGSGCVAIALKHARPDLDVTSVDISAEALAVARRNADRLGIDVFLKQQDGIDAMRDNYDFVVSNPPYIGRDEVTGPGVSAYEPHLALFAGETGLEFYEQMSTALRSPLLIEVGDSQADRVIQIFTEAGHQAGVPYRDLLGINRVLHVQP